MPLTGYLSVLIVWALLLHQLLRFRDKPIEFWHLFIFLEWTFLSGKYVGLLKRRYTTSCWSSSAPDCWPNTQWQPSHSHGLTWQHPLPKGKPTRFPEGIWTSCVSGQCRCTPKVGVCPSLGCVTPRTARQSSLPGSSFLPLVPTHPCPHKKGIAEQGNDSFPFPKTWKMKMSQSSSCLAAGMQTHQSFLVDTEK